MEKNLLYPGKILSARICGKNPEIFSKNRKFLCFSKFDPYTSSFDFFQNFLHSKNTKFFKRFYEATPIQIQQSKKKLRSPKKSRNFPKRDTLWNIGGGTKFSNFDPKFDLYGTLRCAEYESGVRKILKNFPGTLESHKVSRHFATLAITF